MYYFFSLSSTIEFDTAENIKWMAIFIFYPFYSLIPAQNSLKGNVRMRWA